MLSLTSLITLVLCSVSIFAQAETDQLTTLATEDIDFQNQTELNATDFETEEQPYDFKPYPQQQSSISGEVYDQGDFNFRLNSYVQDYHISIYGTLIVNNITNAQTLEIGGEYKFGNFSIKFKANENEGFKLLPIVETQAGIPIKTVASILGKR